MNVQTMTPADTDQHTHAASSAQSDRMTRAELIAPADVTPGQPAVLSYRLSDAQTGAPIADVIDSHECPMHLIAVRRDLQGFQHIHPLPAGAAGEYRVGTAFPEPGTHLLSDEFTRASGATVVQRDALTVGAPGAGPTGLSEDLASKALGTIRVGLSGASALRAGQAERLTFRLEDAGTGQPIRDLQPYPGAPAHGVILSEDGTTFVDTHGEAVGAAASEPAAHAGAYGSADHQSGDHQHAAPATGSGPAAGFGPEIALHHAFETPRLYKVWAQLQTRDGEVVTADFVVRVAA